MSAITDQSTTPADRLKATPDQMCEFWELSYACEICGAPAGHFCGKDEPTFHCSRPPKELHR